MYCKHLSGFSQYCDGEKYVELNSFQFLYISNTILIYTGKVANPTCLCTYPILYDTN